MKVKANGISINYEIKGKGENLVLIHGMGDNLGMWYNQVPVFSRQYRVITYDVRGFGKTESPAGDITIAAHCRDLFELLNATGIRKTFLLGFSMGGRIAIELACTHPEMVKGLIMANSTVAMGPPSEEAMARRRQMAEIFQQKDVKKAMEMMAAGAFSPGFKEKHPKEFEKYVKVKMKNYTPGRTMPASMAGGAPPDVSRIQCPVMFIVGENDGFSGIEQGQKSVEMIPGSQMVTFPTGHAAAIEMPAEFNAAVLKFLAAAPVTNNAPSRP
jgi:2-succinyl-6-hydroxy-2,4-cyclohexadiene-1-carboxylate synthase